MGGKVIHAKERTQNETCYNGDMASRVDSNQPEIVAALRAVGATVLHTHELGRGAPDIIVGFRNKNFLFEIKDGEKSPSRRKLTRDEEVFHSLWKGQISVVESPEQALMLIGAI